MTPGAPEPSARASLPRAREAAARERSPLWRDRLQARLTAYFPMPVRMANWRGIKALVEPRDLATYATLLPQTLVMPAQPLILVEYAEVSPTWHEGIVSIGCRFGDDVGWHGVYWAIDSYFPYAFGRFVGYPKFRADRMTFRRDGSHAQGDVFHRGRHAFAVAFAPYAGDAPEADASLLSRIGLPAAELPHYLLVPADRGPWLNRLSHTEVVSRPPTVHEGRVTVQVDVDEPWAALFEGGRASGPGKLLATDGIGFGWLTARRVGWPR